MSARDRLQTTLLDSYWNDLRRDIDAEAPSGLDPSTAAIVAALERYLRPPEPTPQFLNSLRQRLRADATPPHLANGMTGLPPDEVPEPVAFPVDRSAQESSERSPERRWLREVAKLVAGIVAIALVTGMLALLFGIPGDDGDRGSSDPLPLVSATTSLSSAVSVESPTSLAPSQTVIADDSILSAIEALDRTRGVLDQIVSDGASHARFISVRLTYLISITPRANWIRATGDGNFDSPDTPVWEIEVDGLDTELFCGLGTPTIDCQWSRVVVVLDAESGAEIGVRRPDAGITRRIPPDDIPAVSADAQFGTIESAIGHGLELQLGRLWRAGQTARVVGIWLIRAADYPIAWQAISSNDPVWLLLIEDDCPPDACEVRHIVVILNPMDGLPVVYGGGGAQTRPDSLALRDPKRVEELAVSLVPGKNGQPAWAVEASTRRMTISDVWDRPSDYPGLDPWAPIWRVELADAGYEGRCPADTAGQSVCVFDHVTMILDAASGALLSVTGDPTPVPPATPTPGITPSPSPPFPPIVGVGGPPWPEPTPDNCHVGGPYSAYSTWVMNADGTGVIPVYGAESDGTGDVIWSPDGRSVTYFGTIRDQSDESLITPTPNQDGRFPNPVSTSGIFQKSVESGDVTLLVEVSASEALVWSPDGSRLAFIEWVYEGTRAVHRVMLVNADGSGLTAVGGELTHGDHSPRLAFTPDGLRVTFVRRGDIWVMHGDGTGHINLTDSEDEEFGPLWTPDGEVTFVRFVGATSDGSDPHQLFIVQPDGTNPRPIDNPDFGGRAPVPSPDGSRVALERGGEIWVMNADGSDARNMTQHAAYDGDPRWSPDGTRIMFSSRRVPEPEIRHETGHPRPIVLRHGDSEQPDTHIRACWVSGNSRSVRWVDAVPFPAEPLVVQAGASITVDVSQLGTPSTLSIAVYDLDATRANGKGIGDDAILVPCAAPGGTEDSCLLLYEILEPELRAEVDLQLPSGDYVIVVRTNVIYNTEYGFVEHAFRVLIAS